MKNKLPLLFFALLSLIVGCGDAADVPVYVTINDPIVVSRPNEGSNLHSFSEYFMFHQTSLLGGFSFGHEIPVLAEGNDDILIFAGIRQNTLIEQPARYEMMAPDTFRKNFMPGEIVNFTPTFKYYDNVKFRFIEDCSSALEFTMDLDDDSETKVVCTPGAGYDNTAGGVMNVSEDHPLLFVASKEPLTDFPLSGQVILELTFKTDIEILIGVYAVRNFDSNERFDKVILNPTNEWTKVYINFGPELNTINADAYHIFFAINHALANTSDDVRAVIDDVKLVHR